MCTSASFQVISDPARRSNSIFADAAPRGRSLLLPRNNATPGRERLFAVANDFAAPVVERRSGNYTDCAWDDDYIQYSMRNEYIDEKFKARAEELKRQVLVMLGRVAGLVEQLELVDDLQRLGVAYHFEIEIETMLNRIYKSYVHGECLSNEGDLHSTALAFRLFRQHGYLVSQEIFKLFLDETGRFKPGLCADIEGMISLYEASYLSTQGEAVMEEALTFATANLEKAKELTDTYLDVLSARALDMPLHQRTAISEARWFIEEAYEKKPNMSPLLLQFAKLHFNVVQAMYLEELRDLSRWWKNLGFEKDLSFARDSLVVSYLWGIMASPDPEYEACRKAFAKVIAMVSTVDDIYDIYGTLEELELFTDTFKRWDIDAMKQLPHYMKKCYLACYNCVNGMAYDVLNEKGSDVTLSLKNAIPPHRLYILVYKKTRWEILSSLYMKEARWFHSGYKPSLDEYMSNAWLSVSIPLCLLHGHIFDTKPLDGEQVRYLESLPGILKWSCVILRLTNDLGTSPAEMARGDNPKAIQCYMNDTGASEQAAREHVKTLVREGWKELNGCVMEERTLSKAAVERMLNLVRAGHCFYQYGDGHGVLDGDTKQLMSQLLFDPIPV